MNDSALLASVAKRIYGQIISNIPCKNFASSAHKQYCSIKRMKISFFFSKIIAWFEFMQCAHITFSGQMFGWCVCFSFWRTLCTPSIKLKTLGWMAGASNIVLFVKINELEWTKMSTLFVGMTSFSLHYERNRRLYALHSKIFQEYLVTMI